MAIGVDISLLGDKALQRKLDALGSKAKTVFKEAKERKVSKVMRAMWVSKDPLGFKEHKVRSVKPEIRVYRGIKVSKEGKALKVGRELVLMVHKEHRVGREHKVLKDRSVLKVFRELKECKEAKVFKE